MVHLKKGRTKSNRKNKGGLNTKIHAIADDLVNPTAFLLSVGTDADSTHAIELLSKFSIENSNILGDKAYGTKEIKTYIAETGVTYTILPKSNTKKTWNVITGFIRNAI